MTETNTQKFDFQDEYTFEKRKSESSRIISKYSDRIPIVCEVASSSRSSDMNLDKKKYLVPYDLTIGHFSFVLRKRLKLSPEHALFIFTENGSIPPTSALISTLYETEKNKDGFLYLIISKESTFG